MFSAMFFEYACISWMSDLSRVWLDKLPKTQKKSTRLVLGFIGVHKLLYPILDILIGYLKIRVAHFNQSM